MTGQITGTQISDDAISTPKLAAGAITAGKIAAGAVTADTIAANAITAGKIAAGAVSATEIAANAITASKLYIGDTTNAFPDPLMVDQPNGYVVRGTGMSASVIFNASVANANSISKFAIGIAGAVADTGGVDGPAFSVEAGKPYYFSIFAGAVNADGQTTNCETRLYVRWYDSAGTELSMVLVGSTTLTYGTLTDPSILGKLVAPAGATSARVYMRREGNAARDGARFSSIVVRRAVNGEMIIDGAVTAASIEAGAITTAKLAAGAVTATEIAAGAVTAAKVQAGAISADKIAANTITGDKMVSNSITARELVLTDFANLFPARAA